MNRGFSVLRRAVMMALAVLLIGLVPASAQRSDRTATEPRLTYEASATDRAYMARVAAEHGTVRVIVGLQTEQPGRAPFNTLTESSREAVIAQTQNALLGELGLTRSTAGVTTYQSFPMLALSATPQQFEALTNSGLVTFIQESRWREAQLDTSTGIIGMTGETGAWARGADGSGQTIAILDSGVAGSHPFLTGKVVSEACYGTNDGPEDDPNLPNDAVGFTVESNCPGGVTESTAIGSAVPCNVPGGQCTHGTHVAGIAAGKGTGFSGVAKESTIIAIQVFSKITDGSTVYCQREGYPFNTCILAADADIIKGMDRAFQLRVTYDIAAVNLSFGGGSFQTQAACDADAPAYPPAVAQLVNAGIAVVSSSGNQGSTLSMNLPACITGVISVGATNDNDTIASFTNSTSFLSYMAPGVNIDSADSETNGFSQRTGTSQAAAHVSGAIAAIRSLRPGASLDLIKQALHDSGITVSDQGGTFKRIKVDAALGLLNVPDQPTLLIPAANEAFAETPIIFKWTGGDNTDKYTLQIRDPDNEKIFSESVNHADCGPDAAFPEEDLVCELSVTYPFVDETIYNWQVHAKDTVNKTKTKSELRPFQFDTPGRATLIAPEHKVTIYTPEELFQFQWQEVNLATSYRVTMFDKADGSVKINQTVLESAACVDQVCSYMVSPAEHALLADDKKYKWYVVSIDDEQNTSQSEKWAIKTQFPAAPVLTSPPDGYKFTSLTGLTLTWTEVAGATSYRIRIKDTANNVKVIDETYNLEARTIFCGGGMCSYTVSVDQQSQFKSKHTYSWTVTAANNLGESESDPLTFKAKFPAPPELILPADGQFIDNPAITFQFTQVSDATSYKLKVSRADTNEAVLNLDLTPGGNLACNGTDCSYTLNAGEQSQLKNGKTYKWQAISVSAAGKGKSEKRTFTIQSPLPPALISPPDGHKFTGPEQIAFSWSDVGTGVVYKVIVKDLKNGNKVVKADVGTPCVTGTCSYIPTPDELAAIKNDREFKWFVKATNTVGTSKSAKLTFKTRFE